MNSMWFVFSLGNPPCLFEKCHIADDLKLFSKSCYAFSAVCVFSKKHPPPYFFDSCHTADDLKLFSKSYYEFSAVCVFFQKFQDLVDF